MSISEDEVKQQIILEVGDVDPATGDVPEPAERGIVSTRIDYLWCRFAAWDQVGAGIRELYCRQSAIRLVLGVLAPRRFDSSDNRAGLSVRANQLWEHYAAMLEAVTAEIAQAKSSAGYGGPISGVGSWSSGPYQLGRLTHRHPIEVRYPPDPNSLKYGGTVGSAGTPEPYRAEDVVT